MLCIEIRTIQIWPGKIRCNNGLNDSRFPKRKKGAPDGTPFYCHIDISDKTGAGIFQVIASIQWLIFIFSFIDA